MSGERGILFMETTANDGDIGEWDPGMYSTLSSRRRSRSVPLGNIISLL